MSDEPSDTKPMTPGERVEQMGLEFAAGVAASYARLLRELAGKKRMTADGLRATLKRMADQADKAVERIRDGSIVTVEDFRKLN